MTWFPRVLGVLTAGFGTAVLVRPALLAGPVELTERDGTVSPGVAALTRALACRDIANGLAMACAPTPRVLAAGLAVRTASDAADAAVFGTRLPSPAARHKAVLAAGSWAVLCALSALSLRRRLS